MEAATTLPGTEALYETVRPWLTGRVYVRPMVDRRGRPLGNNGDLLMLKVFERMLDELDVEQVADASAADRVVIPPSGALLEAYAFPQILTEFLSLHRSKPLIVFPSSAFFPLADPASIFAGRTAATLWVLRERHSFDHLRSRWGNSLRDAGVTLGLDHDVVASGHRFVPSVLTGPVSRGRPLLAARWDLEATDLTVATRAAPSRTAGAVGRRLSARLVRGLLPYGPVQTAVTRMGRHRMIANQSEGLRERLPVEVRSTLPPAAARWRTADISAVNLATFDQYARWIREASVVVTDRLHVALPAAALGKRVVLVDNGYHKLRGVYEQSLADLPHVRLVSRAASP